MKEKEEKNDNQEQSPEKELFRVGNKFLTVILA